MLTIGLLLFGVLGVLGAKRLWRRDSAYWDAVPAWWLYGPVSWRAFVRLLPLGVLTSLFGPLWLLGAMFVVPRLPSPTGVGTVVPGWYAGLLLAFVSLVLCIGLTVALFNWPKVLVPPHMRSDAGLLRRNSGRP